MKKNNTIMQEEALKNFLFDIACLEQLEDINSFNAFDVLKIARTEIRHSNVLAWLLCPKENHGFGEKILHSLNLFIVKAGFVNNNTAFKIFTMNYSDVIIYREWQNIDILIESKEEKYIICIENKVDSQDHDNQLNKYFEIINSKYDDEYTKIFLYLTPDGLAPRQDDYGVWNCIKYETIIHIIEKELQQANLNPDVKGFISNYVEILRRETMENTKISELCQEIYRRHKMALDLIYEHRPDRLQNVAEYLMMWCKKQNANERIIFVEEKSSKSYCRFRTQYMDSLILSSDGISGWGTKNHYFYEIASYLDKNDNVKFCIQLAFNSTNLERENRNQLEKIDNILENRKLKENWQWRTVFKTKTVTVKENELLPDMSDNDNNIYKNLDKMLEEIFKLEEKLKVKINQQN